MKKSLEDIEIIFLVSRGRSGSTLLQSILDAHPNICAPLESKFVLHLKTKYHHITDWDETTIQFFIKDIYTNRKYRLFWHVSKKRLTHLFSQYQINNFIDACKVIYLSYHSMFPKEDIQLIIDKNPLYSIFIPQIQEIFPEAKFIHLIREPKASSYSHVKSNMQKNIINSAYDWRIYNERIEESKQKNPSIFFTLFYEKMTQHPHKEIKLLFQFLQLPFNEQLLRANETIKTKYKASNYLSLSHHIKIAEPINTKNINQWKGQISNKEKEIINLICTQLLTKYNYSFETPINTSLHIELIEKAAKKSIRLEKILHFLFKLPFSIRLLIYSVVSIFRDKRYKLKIKHLPES